MWRLVLDDDTMLTEKMVGYWDNIGKETRIKEIVFRIRGERLSFSGAKKYCVARIGQLSVSAQQRHVGYCVTLVNDSNVSEIKILFNKIEKREYPIEQLQIPERCLRLGC